VERSNTKSPWTLLSLLLAVGALAAFSTLVLLSYQSEVPNWGLVIAILFGVFFICWTCSLILYLRWRERRATDPELLRGTVYGLVPGAQYQVVQTFEDYYKNEFQRGDLLRFKERHYLPYHGGHTIIFDQRSLYLQDDENSAVLSNFSEYITRVE
jgi:hypothetical protein